jgi:hypothetical protein
LGIFGVALAVFGCLALVIGTAQFLRSRRGIESGEFVSAAAAYMVVVAGRLGRRRSRAVDGVARATGKFRSSLMRRRTSQNAAKRKLDFREFYF